ncbi:hypothetical protein N8766_03145 [bacterium]|jgi:hypothetical protein|nr:hypothetical protein [Verrucomicrobiota bacterium]MDA7633081.1 hypothetical protein [bacterium]MDA7657741.1 hypothetical protein [Verrucomicrobiota bacterium]
MAFSKLIGRLRGRWAQTFRVLFVGVVCQWFAVACSDPATPEESVSTPDSTAIPATPLEPATTIGSSESTGQSGEKAELKAAKEVENIKETEEKSKETVASSEKKVIQEPVEFPEMKISDEALAIRKLFVQANKQFNEKRYIGAIQTLRNLDAMELGEKEEMALDLFLKRIEKALEEDTKTPKETTKE